MTKAIKLLGSIIFFAGDAITLSALNIFYRLSEAPEWIIDLTGFGVCLALAAMFASWLQLECLNEDAKGT